MQNPTPIPDKDTHSKVKAKQEPRSQANLDDKSLGGRHEPLGVEIVAVVVVVVVVVGKTRREG